MANNQTYGRLKSKVLLLLEENDTGGTCVCSDTERDRIISSLPEVASSCLIRLYESAPAVKCDAFATLFAVSDTDECFIPDTVRNEFLCFTIPSDLMSFCSISGDISFSELKTDGGKAYIKKAGFRAGDKVYFEYKPTPPTLSSTTADSFEFDMPSLCFEALCALVASEACRSENSTLYSRLYLTYSELFEGLCGKENIVNTRKNTFYKQKGRW